MSITTEEMNILAERIDNLRRKESEAAQAKKVITEELEVIETMMLDALMESQLKNYRAPAGLASVGFRLSVKTPKTAEDVALLAEYTKKVGKYDLVFKPGSAAITSFYKEEAAQAEERGEEDFKVPGLTEVTMTPILSFTRPK